MFLDGVSMILIAASLLHPILVGSVRRIWIGVLMVKVAEGALITPQVLLFLSVCRSVTTANLGVPLERVHQFRDLPQVLSEHVTLVVASCRSRAAMSSRCSRSITLNLAGASASVRVPSRTWRG